MGDALLKRRIALCISSSHDATSVPPFAVALRCWPFYLGRYLNLSSNGEVLPSPCPQTRLFVKSSNINRHFNGKIMGKNQAK